MRKLNWKKTVAVSAALALCVGTLAGCGSSASSSSTAASGDTLTADCILTDEVTVPATGDATTTVYLAGCFNPDKLVAKDEYTMTEADKSALRMNGIAVLPVTEM